VFFFGERIICAARVKNLSKKRKDVVDVGFWGARCAAWPGVKAPPPPPKKKKEEEKKTNRLLLSVCTNRLLARSNRLLALIVCTNRLRLSLTLLVRANRLH
jgi:hypothetical protein